MKKAGIAILGLGEVGGGVYKILTENREFFAQTQGVDLTVESILEKDSGRFVRLGISEDLAAHNIAEIVSDPDVNIVVECIGCAETAKEFVLAALCAGKTVVVSDRELICKYARELERSAKRHNAGIFFEASCSGGIPVVRTLLDGLQSNRISALTAIASGAVNAVLTDMTERGLSYEAARKAWEEGEFAAAAEGLDGAYRLSILASLAFHTGVPVSKIYREGIAEIAPDDIAEGKALGCVLKFLAIGKCGDDGLEVRVHPAFVRKDHPLASVEGNRNAVCVTGDSVGEVMLCGAGDGALSAGSAIVSDVIYAATHTELRDLSLLKNSADRETRFVNDFKSAYYLRISAADESGVLANISSILGKYGISVAEMVQHGSAEAEKSVLALITHETREFAVKNAVAKLNATGRAKVVSVVRVAQ